MNFENTMLNERGSNQRNITYDSTHVKGKSIDLETTLVVTQGQGKTRSQGGDDSYNRWAFFWGLKMF